MGFFLLFNWNKVELLNQKTSFFLPGKKKNLTKGLTVVLNVIQNKRLQMKQNNYSFMDQHLASGEAWSVTTIAQVLLSRSQSFACFVLQILSY